MTSSSTMAAVPAVRYSIEREVGQGGMAAEVQAKLAGVVPQ